MTDGATGTLLSPVTVSVGADRALFDAKQGGRNRVVAAPLPPGLAKPRLVA